MVKVKDVKKGQVIQITVREDNGLCYWMYAVANNVFDDRIEFIKEDGSRHMHLLAVYEDEAKLTDDQKDEFFLKVLYKDGKPVFAKRTLNRRYKFGRYVF